MVLAKQRQGGGASSMGGASNKKIQKRLLVMIYFQAQLLLSFVNDLLDLKQIRKGVYERVCAPFDPLETI